MTKVSKEINSQLRNIIKEISAEKQGKLNIKKIMFDKCHLIQKKSIKSPINNKKKSIEV